MCGREDSFSSGLFSLLTAGCDPILGPDEEKPDRVGRDRQIGMPTIICSAIDLFQAAGIFLLTSSVIILFSF